MVIWQRLITATRLMATSSATTQHIRASLNLRRGEHVRLQPEGRATYTGCIIWERALSDRGVGVNPPKGHASRNSSRAA